MQAFLVSRIVKYFRMPGVLLTLPLVALSGNVLIAAGAGFAVVRAAKMAENATDYSVMNTGRQMLWLPTKREEKYKAKQAIDTFFVRAGDVLSARHGVRGHRDGDPGAAHGHREHRLDRALARRDRGPPPPPSLARRAIRVRRRLRQGRPAA